jgi:hypothetical protein
MKFIFPLALASLVSAAATSLDKRESTAPPVWSDLGDHLFVAFEIFTNISKAVTLSKTSPLVLIWPSPKAIC